MLPLLVIGLIIGSFLNVLIWRLNDPRAPKFWEGRSICPHCRKKLPWRDNIPLLSFLLLGGRCRFCHRKISWQYPVVELTAAIVTAMLWPNLFVVLLSYCFIVIFFSDLIYGLIPDEMIVLGLILGFFIHHDWLVGLASALGFFLIVLVTRFRGMGLGDVKLAFLMGFLLGFPKVVVAFWMAFVIGGAVAIGLVLLKKARISDRMALGPYLVLGTVISALWSKMILATLSWSW